MSELEKSDLSELIELAEFFLRDTGFNPDSEESPSIYMTDREWAESKVSYVPRSNYLVFDQVDEGDFEQVWEDTVKTISKAYSGIKNSDFEFDSSSYDEYKKAVDMLPEGMEFDLPTLEDAEELRLASELWRRREENVKEILDEKSEQFTEIKEEYDEAVETIDELDSELNPKLHDGSFEEGLEYVNSKYREIIDRAYVGDEDVPENIEQKKEGIKQQARDIQEEESYDEEYLEEIIEKIDQDYMDEIRSMYEDMEVTRLELHSEIKDEMREMVEGEEANEMEKATVYLLEPLINGTLADPEMSKSIEHYFDKIRKTEDEETAYFAEKIYEEFLHTNGKRKKERFKEAVYTVEQEFNL